MFELISKYVDPEVLKQAAKTLESLSTAVLDVSDAITDVLDEWSENFDNIAEAFTPELSLEDKWAAVKASGKSTQTVSIINSLIEQDGHERFAVHIEALYKYHVVNGGG